MKPILAIAFLLPVAAQAQTPAAPAPKPASAAAPKPAAAPASKSKGDFLVAPKLGLFVPTSRLGAAFFAGIEFGYVTPGLDHHLAVVLDVNWTRPRTKGYIVDPRIVAGDGFYNLGNAEVGILLSALYRFEDAAPGLTPYAGLGPGLYSHRTVVQSFQSQYTETEWRVGVQCVAGLDYTVGPGAVFAEARYHFTRVDFLSTGRSNVGGFVIPGVGYRLRF
jgi:hypothetical protein